MVKTALANQEYQFITKIKERVRRAQYEPLKVVNTELNINLVPMVREISWSKHVVILKKCKEPQERLFYTQATKRFGWTKDVLINQIENQRTKGTYSIRPIGKISVNEVNR